MLNARASQEVESGDATALAVSEERSAMQSAGTAARPKGMVSATIRVLHIPCGSFWKKKLVQNGTPCFVSFRFQQLLYAVNKLRRATISMLFGGDELLYVGHFLHSHPG